MSLEHIGNSLVSTDFEQILDCLRFTGGEKLLELGCGPADVSRKLAHEFPELQIVATEVDDIQHAKNLESKYPSNLGFQYGGAEAIDMPDASVNFVLMLKSLHHVPMELMQKSLDEIRRVLVPGGLAYISEPVYAGAFNDILRLFHDEKEVRQAAIDAINDTVFANKLRRVKQVCFDSIWRFQGFSEFEQKIIGATHSEFNISSTLHKEIEDAFAPFVDSDGVAEFRSSNRVDLLRRQTQNQDVVRPTMAFNWNTPA